MDLIYDDELFRPGCVLIQAAAGCDPHIAQRFDAKHWLVGITPGMKRFSVTPEQLDLLVKITEKRAVLNQPDD